jgi:hypothetical protein
VFAVREYTVLEKHTPYLRVFVFSVCIKSSSVVFVNAVFFPTIPAFAKNTSSLPYLSIASLTTAFTAASSDASNFRGYMSTEGYRDFSSRSCTAR